MIVFENGVVPGVMILFPFQVWILFWPEGSADKVNDMCSGELRDTRRSRHLARSVWPAF
ncbi:hypothetical protein Q427_18880 [Halomonas sp. BC04]|nr:hypothetical protein Q427_18880 [Halomonas sp. BC04]